MHAIEIQRGHLRGYKDFISQTCFSAYEHYVSKLLPPLPHKQNNIFCICRKYFSMKRKLINRGQITVIQVNRRF